MKSVKNIAQFKMTFLKICLRVAAVAMALETLVIIYTHSSHMQLILSMFLMVLSVSSLVLLRDPVNFSLVAVMNSIAWTIAFVFYWYDTYGVHGALAYVYFVLLIVFIIILPNPFSSIYALLLCGLCLVLTVIAPIGNEEGFETSTYITSPFLAAEYLICLFVFTIALYLLKVNFDKDREQAAKSKVYMSNLTNQLIAKRAELIQRRQEIERIQNNLERLVDERTEELEKKNKQLSQYAYDNAHILRGPLCNILGVLKLLEKDKNSGKSETFLSNINKRAHQLDQLMGKINLILR